MVYTATLRQFYFSRLAPHTHSYTKPQKKMEVATSLFAAVESFSHDFDSELPPTWSAGSYLAPARVAVQRHEQGFRRYLSADKGEGKLLMLRVGRGGWWTLRPAGRVSGPHRQKTLAPTEDLASRRDKPIQN